jgi:hypothetical protein
VEPINQPDLNNESAEYWELVLRSHNLSVDRGRVSRKMVSHVGGLNNLVGIEKEDFIDCTGQVKPTGKGPDK